VLSLLIHMTMPFTAIDTLFGWKRKFGIVTDVTVDVGHVTILTLSDETVVVLGLLHELRVTIAAMSYANVLMCTTLSLNIGHTSSPKLFNHAQEESARQVVPPSHYYPLPRGGPTWTLLLYYYHLSCHNRMKLTMIIKSPHGGKHQTISRAWCQIVWIEGAIGDVVLVTVWSTESLLVHCTIEFTDTVTGLGLNPVIVEFTIDTVVAPGAQATPWTVDVVVPPPP
jgi:hypothetical protein